MYERISKTFRCFGVLHYEKCRIFSRRERFLKKPEEGFLRKRFRILAKRKRRHAILRVAFLYLSPAPFFCGRLAAENAFEQAAFVGISFPEVL
jgi:hypothetical protein